MAPEMVLEKTYDYRIDIWALGVLLYELVHGRAPFQAANLKEMKEKCVHSSELAWIPLVVLAELRFCNTTSKTDQHDLEA